MTIIVPKSGCNHTKKTTIHKKVMNGKYQLLKSVRCHLYFFKNDAKNTIRASFKNSVG